MATNEVLPNEVSPAQPPLRPAPPRKQAETGESRLSSGVGPAPIRVGITTPIALGSGGDQAAQLPGAVSARSASGQFSKGVSGNPKGRPPTRREARRLAREANALCVERLLELVAHGSGVESLKAVALLQDRAWGKVAPTRCHPSPQTGDPRPGGIFPAASEE
jgi:hypothetical protein